MLCKEKATTRPCDIRVPRIKNKIEFACIHPFLANTNNPTISGSKNIKIKRSSRKSTDKKDRRIQNNP